ncbi:TorF family putative porin [Pseudoalteromonas peptidolytica]|uniref:TorF family putative porin n=1 Tax=Pseudoalteromonas peptidolytica TaxID=61150 RepID=UPI00298D8F68|nr:TorF family putative porin [Pseudoalteromonas peptidolytica]MDW7547625.1 TorF family putative porin [Pseudoalteromonas peptidolytica]
MKKLLLCSTLFSCFSVSAATSSTVTLVSDYLFNGVSQTGEDPALQASFDWAGDSGLYAGVWASNVDFGDDTDIEFDGYVGYYIALTSSINIDIGIAQYTYHGGDISDDYNYAEAYAKFNYGNTNLNFWHAWDYFGTGAGHSIVMLTHDFPLTERLSFGVGVDYSMSHDEDKWQWESGDDYLHWRATFNYAIEGWNLSLGYEDTDLDTQGDSTILATVSRTFNF